MGERRDKEFVKLMDMLELVHAENIQIMTMLINFFCNKDLNAKKTAQQVIDIWVDKYNDIRTRW